MKGDVRETADERVGEGLRLDGNTAAGLLSEIFVPVLRCPECGTVVLRVARVQNQLWLDLTGACLVVMPEAPGASGI
jgi:hypothetical protein